MSDDNQNNNTEPEPSSADAPSYDAGAGSKGPESGEECLKLYIGNIDYATDAESLRENFSKFGTITDCFCPVDRNSNRPRGFGFVTFANREDAMKAIAEMDNTDLGGRMIRVSESRPKEIGGRGAGGGGFPVGEFNSSGSPEVKLFVGNLAFETDLETIKELFQKEGDVKDCYMPKDRATDQPRGFAFITMPSEDAKAAMKKLQGHELDNRALRIEESMPRRGDASRGGGGGRGGGGFGERDTYPPRGGGGYDPYGGGGRDRNDDRGGYGRDRGGGGGGYGDRDSYSSGRDRNYDRDSYRGRDRYDDDRGDRSSRDDRGSRYDDRGGDRKTSYSRDREDRYRSGDRDRDRY
jgi:nucleolin